MTKRNEILILPTIFVRKSTDEWVLASRRPWQIGIAWLNYEFMWEMY